MFVKKIISTLLALVIVSSFATIGAQELKDEKIEEEYKFELASFTTKYSTKDKGRSANIHLAADKINGTVLKENDEFSFNEVVGKRTSKNGFKTAKIISGGKYVDGIGGGICQVSTTLYNTALFSNMTITSARNHGLKVSYVDPGRDATVSWGSIDFKFKNPYKQDIKIVCTYKDGELTSKIMIKEEINKGKIEIKTTNSKNKKTYTTVRFKDGVENYRNISTYKKS